MDSVLGIGRSRLAWWGVALVAAGAVGLFLYSFIGTFVLGLFVYYAARPIHRRVLRHVESRSAAATLTLTTLVLPALVLLGYSVYIAFQEFLVVAGPGLTKAVLQHLVGGSDPLATLLHEPLQFLQRLERIEQLQQRLLTGLRPLSVAANGLLHLTLALAFAFFLYRDGYRLAQWFESEIGEHGSGAHAFLVAVDRDLETVYFGNLLTVLLVTGLAIVVYNGFAFFAPPALRLPFPTLLALLTGLATFIPLVVGKVVYVPLTLYLLWEALRADPRLLWVPFVFFLVSLVVLDLIPQTILRPYISGRRIHTGLILFAYILGLALFGWYGLFFGPLLAVVVVQVSKVILPELLRGEPVTPATASAVQIGAEPPDSGSVEEVYGPDDEGAPAEEMDASDEAGSDQEGDDA